jgi:cysteinyl-tRNA synthetase
MPARFMARLNRGGYSIEVSYLTNLTDSKDKVIKRNARGKSIIDINDLKIIDYFFNNKGEPMLNRCRIYVENVGWLVLEEPYEEMRKYKMDGTTVEITGFKQKTIKNKNGKPSNRTKRST